MHSRNAIDGIRATIRTKITNNQTGEGISARQKYMEFLDEYFQLGQNRRVDFYMNGNRQGEFEKQYRKVGEAVFFTNELNHSGGKNVLEVRQSDESVAQQDIRLIGLGIGTMRQAQRSPLMVIGENKNAARVVRSLAYQGLVLQR